MSTISAASSNMIIESSTATYENPNATLGEQEFIELLITQLQNQDPLEPMDTTEMTSQLTEFSTLDQLEQMNSNMASMNSFSTLGKEVTYSSSDSSLGISTEETGIVTSVKMVNGVSYLEVNDSHIEMSSIIEVREASTSTTEEGDLS